MSHLTDMSGHDLAEWNFLSLSKLEVLVEEAVVVVTDLLKAQSELRLSSKSLWKMGRISMESTLLMFWLDMELAW